jgi:hypothetical protein
MSFGYGVGDIIGLGCLAWNVYQACKDVPARFGQLTQEVLSLHAVIKEVQEAIWEEDLSLPRRCGLQVVMNGCRSVLEDLEKLLTKYERLGTKANRTWERMGWASTDISLYRERLVSNTVLLTAFLRFVNIDFQKLVLMQF